VTRILIDIDDEKLARAQRALLTATKHETVNAALDVAAAIEAGRRIQALEEFRNLLDRLDVDGIKQKEIKGHTGDAV